MTPGRLLYLSMPLVVTLAASTGFADALAADSHYLIGTSTVATSSVETDCNFNGTAVPCPDYIWFIAVGKLSTPALAPITVFLTDQHIQFTANSINYDITVPDGATTFDGTATTATTTFTGANTWSTQVKTTAS